MAQHTIDGPLFKEMVIKGAAMLEKNKKILDAMNVFPVPDGDTGTNMSLTMMSAVWEIKNLETASISKMADAVSLGALKGARGNSGVILSQLFRGFAKAIAGLEQADADALAEGMRGGVEAAYKAVLKPKEGTILTVARYMANKALDTASYGSNVYLVLDAALEEGEAILKKTPDMLPILKQAGVVDAGGQGLLVLYTGFKMALDGEEVGDMSIFELGTEVPLQTEGVELTYQYCTEFLIKNIYSVVTPQDIDRLREKLEKAGDCVLVVGDINLLKVHIHTNEPGKALQFALRLGELSAIKIDNMKEQHRPMEEIAEKPKKPYAIAAVAIGDGLVNIFKDLGVDEVIQGGQTMNPSTETIAKAINKSPSDTVIVLPNNKNIILAAQQAGELSKKRVVVIPTRSIPQGISAAIAFNPEASLEQNEAKMKKAMESVNSGSVTFAVRATTLEGKQIQEGDILGLENGLLLHVGKDVEKVAHALMKGMVKGDESTILIFYGKDVKKEEAEAFAEKVSKEHPECDVEVQYGGQPLYFYVFSVE
ncbi:MAG: DAK2 domain-containing protein [Bacillota bacterium]|nr:DAK2 domain-containing protein [Bacillota bacterium]